MCQEVSPVDVAMNKVKDAYSVLSPEDRGEFVEALSTYAAELIVDDTGMETDDSIDWD